MEPPSAFEQYSTQGSPEKIGNKHRQMSFERSAKKCNGMFRKDGKCCDSLFHHLQPKPPPHEKKDKEKSFQPKSQMQKLKQQTEDIELKGQQIIDSAI
jgi:hypothetical protein